MKYLSLAVYIIIIASCKKNSQNNSSGLDGIYLETSPTANENQFNFVSSNQLIITSNQRANQLNFIPGTFKYQIDNSVMTLVSMSSSKPDTISYLVYEHGKDSLSVDYNCACLCPCPLSLNVIFVKK
ncbi:MAG TPA: hypothetical protein VMT76_05860 [Puia sp.]|nr:hypothetical protein [Puia sp.]